MADTGACMTPDQCFDEMAVALGVAEPKDTGYTELLDLVKKLKEENEKLQKVDEQLEDALASLNFFKEQCAELKHKEYCLRQDAKGYSPSEVQEYREETEELKEENKKLKEENQELQENLTHTEDNSWDYYGELLKLKQDLHYYRCFVNAADPKCNMMNAMEKQDVDDYTDDPELAKHLYEMFHIEESDEEDSDEEEKKDHSGGWSPTSSPEPKQ